MTVKSVRPMTNCETELIEDMPALLLPFTFSNGSVIEGVGTSCQCCGKEIQDMRGEWQSFNEFSVSLAAFGICWTPGCSLIQPVEARFSDDGSCIIKGAKGWMPSRYIDEKPAGWFVKVKTLFRGVK